MAKETKEKTNQELQIELLTSQVENLTSKVSKPQTSEENYQARQALYDSKADERAALQLKINERRMEIMMLPALMGKAKMSDVIILEAWERKSKELAESNPDQSIRLMNQYKRRIYEIARQGN